MYQSILADAGLYRLLLRLDQDLARTAQATGCGRCGGRLDRADYARKPRGVPLELGPEHAVRLSLCCAVEGCRRRTPPPSVRFLGRRVYVGAAIVGITALAAGTRRSEVRALRTWLGLSARTLARGVRRECVLARRERPAARAGCGRRAAGRAAPTLRRRPAIAADRRAAFSVSDHDRLDVNRAM